MKTQTTIGIVSAPTPAMLEAVAVYKRKMARMAEEREMQAQAAVAAKEAEKWQRPNRPFAALISFATAQERKQAEANAAASKRLPDGRFKSKSAIAADIKKARKLKVLGCNGK